MIHVVLFNNQSNLDAFLKAEVWLQGHDSVRTFGGCYGNYLITVGNDPMYTTLTPSGVVNQWRFNETPINEITKAIVDAGGNHIDWLFKQEQQTAGSAP